MQRKWLVLIVVGIAAFMAGLDLFIVNIAFPDVARDFGGTSVTTLSWILSAYAIVFAALLVPAGRWADALGRKRLFLGGLAVFTLASAACAAAPSVGVLIAARVVQATGAALMLPTSLGLLLPEFPPEQRSLAVAIWSALSATAAAAGPPLGGLLVEVDWRLVFLVNIPVGLVALVAGARVLREIRDPSTVRPDALGALTIAGAVGAVVVAITEGESWGWTSAGVLALFAAAAALAAVAAWRCGHHPAPVIDPAIVRVTTFSAAVVASVLFFAGFAAMLLGDVLFLTTAWNESVLDAGLMLAPGPATAALFSVPGARLGARVGQRWVGLLGTLFMAAAGVWWLTRLGTEPAYAADFLPGGLLSGVGAGLVIPTFTGAAAGSLPAERFATGAAVVTMGRQVGSALGVAVIAATVGGAATAGDFDAAWIAVIVPALAAGALFGALGPGVARAPAAVAPEAGLAFEVAS